MRFQETEKHTKLSMKSLLINLVDTKEKQNNKSKVL